jgi:hypothetical protein
MSGSIKMPDKLALQHPIGTANALLLTQLLSVAGLFTRTTGTMLSRTGIPALQCALADTLITFQKKFYALAPA